MSELKIQSYRLIFTVFVVLAILTIVEYFVGIYAPSAVFLMIIAFIKAALVVNYFMHIYRLWREDDH